MSDGSWAVAELVATVALPAVALMWLTDDAYLGPAVGLVVALLAPLVWAVVSAVRERRVSALAVIAAVSVLLTGGVGLFELDVRWFALKEALVPAGMGLVVIVTAHTRFAAIAVLLDRVLDPERTTAALHAAGGAVEFSRVSTRGTRLLGGVMLISAAATYALARVMVRSASGSEGFGTELGRYTIASLVAVGLPIALAMAWVLRGVILALEDASGTAIDALLRTTGGERDA